MPVLDFRRGPKPRNYLARREQSRLLMFVLGLGLVVVLMFEARNPRHYRWLLAGGGPAPSADRVAQADDRRVVPEPDDDELPGTFLSPGPVAPGEPAPSRYFPGVDPAYLEAVRDNKPLGVSEWESWLHLFDVLHRNDEATLRRAAEPATYVQLFEQSNDYRGELVTIGGVIRRAHPAKTPRNEYGLTDYYQVWLRPNDHPQDPVVVWCVHLPEGFPLSMEMAEPAEVTGFHFKVFVYKSADGVVRRAPMLLARNIRWAGAGPVGPGKSVAADEPPLTALSSTLLIVGAVGLAVLAAAIVYYRTRRVVAEREDSLPHEDALRAADAGPGVTAALQQLAEDVDTPGHRA